MFVCSQELPETDIIIEGKRVSRQNAIIFQLIFADLLTAFKDYIDNPEGGFDALRMLPAITKAEFLERIEQLRDSIDLIAHQA